MIGSSARLPRSALYRALSLALESGLDPLRALESADAALRARFARAVERRASFAEALEDTLECPPLETGVLRAAERAGRLPEALADLADDLETEDRARRQALARCAYPLVVLHLVPLAAQASVLLDSPLGYALSVARSWLMLWALLAAAVLGHRALLSFPAGLALLRRIPLLGALELRGQEQRFLNALRWLHGAGVLWRDAIPLAASCASTSARIPEIEAAERAARSDRGMEETLLCLSSLPTGQSAQLQTAAHVGGLEDALRRVAAQLQEQRLRTQARLARTSGAILYAGAVLLVAITVLRFYSGYLGAL